MTSLVGRRISARPKTAAATPAGNGAIDAHAAMHVAIAGQSFWQSGTAGFSGRQQAMSSDMGAVPAIDAIMAA
jgi:hypothetical protein